MISIATTEDGFRAALGWNHGFPPPQAGGAPVSTWLEAPKQPDGDSLIAPWALGPPPRDERDFIVGWITGVCGCGAQASAPRAYLQGDECIVEAVSAVPGQTHAIAPRSQSTRRYSFFLRKRFAESLFISLFISGRVGGPLLFERSHLHQMRGLARTLCDTEKFVILDKCHGQGDDFRLLGSWLTSASAWGRKSLRGPGSKSRLFCGRGLSIPLQA